MGSETDVRKGMKGRAGTTATTTSFLIADSRTGYFFGVGSSRTEYSLHRSGELRGRNLLAISTQSRSGLWCGLFLDHKLLKRLDFDGIGHIYQLAAKIA